MAPTSASSGLPATTCSVQYGCSRTCTQSSWVNSPGRSQMLSATAARPTSHTRPARRAVVTCSAARPRWVAARSARSPTAAECPWNIGDLRSTASPNAARTASSRGSGTSRWGCGSRSSRAARTSVASRAASSDGARRHMRSAASGSSSPPARARTATTAASGPDAPAYAAAQPPTCARRVAGEISSPRSRRGRPLPFHHSKTSSSAPATGAGSSSRPATSEPTWQLARLKPSVISLFLSTALRSVLIRRPRGASRVIRGRKPVSTSTGLS